jgi:hypothetical protein
MLKVRFSKSERVPWYSAIHGSAETFIDRLDLLLLAESTFRPDVEAYPHRDWLFLVRKLLRALSFSG